MTRTPKKVQPSLSTTRQQKGAALIIVLLLVATISIVAIGLTERTVITSTRIANEQARSTLLWRMTGAEILAGELLGNAISARPGIMSNDDPWAVQPFDLAALAVTEFESGEARFADATRCFNLNSLLITPPSQETGVQSAPSSDDPLTLEPGEAEILEFVALLDLLGIANNDARQLAIIIRDWIDGDQETGIGGAEDSAYLRLPVPYRTGGTLLSDKSELRTMIGVDQVLMRTIAPFVCALPVTDSVPVNINMLRPQDAPILVSVFRGELSLSDAELIIERRPLGGYGSVEEVTALPFVAGLAVPPSIWANRIATSSAYLRGQIRLEFGPDGLRSRSSGNTLLQSTVLFQVNGDDLSVISRRFGSSS